MEKVEDKLDPRARSRRRAARSTRPSTTRRTSYLATAAPVTDKCTARAGARTCHPGRAGAGAAQRSHEDAARDHVVVVVVAIVVVVESGTHEHGSSRF